MNWRNNASLLTLLLATFALSIPVSCLAQSATPGGNASKEVAFVKKVSRNASFADFRAALPSGTKITDSSWSRTFEIYCNVVHFTGAVTGVALFQSQDQRDYEDVPKSKAPAKVIALKPSDSLVHLYVYMDNGLSQTISDKIRIDALTEILGEPLSKSLDSQFGHWTADWKLPDGRRLTYGSEAEIVGETAQKPVLCFLN